MWLSNWKKDTKIIVTSVFAVLVLLVTICPGKTKDRSTLKIGSKSFERETSAPSSATEKSVNSLPEKIYNENQIRDTLIEKGYTLENASSIQEILKTIGIESIKVYATSGAGTPNTSLFTVVCYPNGLTSRSKRFFFTTENGILFYAGYSGEDLYDSEKGGFLKKYDDG